MEPLTIISTISVALKLIDQFRETALRWVGTPVNAPSATVEQSGKTLQVRYSNGAMGPVVRPEDLHMDKWDSVRYDALDSRVTVNWNLFNRLFKQTPLLAGLQLAQVEEQMNRCEKELCTDFKEMVKIYERVLNIGLPDHYQLYEVCK